MTKALSLFDERLQERVRAARLRLTSEEAGRFERYFRLLSRWNSKINLTALPLKGFPAATLDRLFVEPLIAAELVDDRSAFWFDLGSGGGSPAMPLSIVRPLLHLTMVDSVSKKTAFLREAAREAGLSDARVLTSRIEELTPAHAGVVDLITIRAVRFDERLAEAMRRLLKPGGRLLRFGPAVEATPEGFEYRDRRALTRGGDSVTVFERV